MSSSVGSSQTQKLVRRIFQIVFSAIAIFWAMFPVIWILSASFNARGTLSGQTLIPANFTLDHYVDLLTNPLTPFPNWMWNSLKVSSIASVLSVFLTAISAYAFSRFRFRGRTEMLLIVFLMQVFPTSLTFVAVFLIIQALGKAVPMFGLNTHAGLILVYLGGVMGINVWLMKGFFDTVPRALDESAKIDGASHWQTYWQIILPLVRPVLAIVGLLTFVGTYSDFLIPQILLQDAEQFTLAVGLITFARQQFGQNWGIFSAGAIMGAVPIIILWFFLQDFVVNGLTSGAVKG